MVLYATQPKTLNPADPYNKVSTCAQRPTASNRSAVLPSSSTGIICGVRIRRLAGAHRTRLTSANRRRRHWPPDAMPSRYCEFVDSRLRRSPPDRASAVPYGQAGENAARFPHLAHRSAAAHKLHSTPQQDRINLISGNRETSSRLPALAYSPRKLSRRPAPSQTPRRRSIEVEPEGGQAMLAKSTGRKSMHRPFRQLRLLSAYVSWVVFFMVLSSYDAGNVHAQEYKNY